jgi:hypothetical protein
VLDLIKDEPLRGGIPLAGRDGGIGALRSNRRMFVWVAMADRGVLMSDPVAQSQKSFLVLFFKKEPLALTWP